VVEYPAGYAVVSVLTDDAVLLVLLRQDANLGQLLLELRRHRGQIASLV
jgi:predicted regulator of Ras-like GTPase activity (Roadblock/LC7/MglB family)